MRRRRFLMKLGALLRHPFDRVKITPLGRFFSVFTLFFGVAAINSGNNLLYFILAYLLILLFSSGILSTFNIAGLEIEAYGQDDLYKGKRGMIYLKVKKRRFYSFLLFICTEYGCTFLPYVDKKGRVAKVEIEAIKRGINVLNNVFVYSVYPFGFARRGVYVNLSMEYIVFPRIDLPVYATGHKENIRYGKTYGQERGYEGEFKGLKRYEIGERLFHIHWKKAFKELNVKVFEGEKSETYYISVSHAMNEDEIDKVASLVHNIMEEGKSVGIVMNGKVIIPPGKGKNQERAILNTLAML